MKLFRSLLCSAIIMSVAVITCYGVNDNNEDEREVRKVIETYFEGLKMENLDLVMSTISPSFLQIIDVEGEIGAKIDYDRTKKAYIEFFEANIILNFNGEITKIEIADNKATVATSTGLEAFSLKESKNFGGNRSFLFFLEKQDNKWLIIDRQG